jgi:hypothetical protein
MLDHVFSDAISALRDAFSNAFLERQAFDEHFQSDVLLGDLVWETSYGLPGEGRPSWSQAIYRAWYTDEIFHEAPEIEMEIVFRVQRLADQPSASIVADLVPLKSPQMGKDSLARDGITIEINQPTPRDKKKTSPLDFAIEVTYSGSYELAEETLQDGTSKLLDENFGALGSWIATTLVNLGDVKLSFLAAEEA